MPRLPVRHRTPLLLTLALAVGACAPASTDPAGRDAITDVGSHPYIVSVRNDGPVALTAVRILTSEADTIDVARLERGATSAAHGVGRLHASPLVRVTAGGRELVAHPIEGFVEAWNPRLAEGRYVIRLDAREGLGVAVERVP